MQISNQGCSLIRIDSGRFSSVISSPDSYTSVGVVATLNCCSDIYTSSVPIHGEALECSSCEGARWQIDLTSPAQLGRSITGISIINLTSGEVIPLPSFTPITWTAYTTACPQGTCQIQSVSAYNSLFYNPLDDWFSSFLGWNNIVASFCGNVLMICGLPTGWAPYAVHYNDDLDQDVTQLFTFSGNGVAFFNGSSLYISPAFFGASLLKFQDGVYKFTVRVTETDGSWTEETMCFFFDCITKCKVAALIGESLSDITTGKDTPFYDIHMIHYALTNDGNCGCNCDDMCQLFAYLSSLLDNTQTPPCGC